MKKSAAILILRPGAEFNVRGDTVEWLDKNLTQPTEDEIDVCMAANEYRELRAPEYPLIGDQLDALWKGGDAAAAMLAQVQAVKAKYPKP